MSFSFIQSWVLRVSVYILSGLMFVLFTVFVIIPSNRELKQPYLNANKLHAYYIIHMIVDMTWLDTIMKYCLLYRLSVHEHNE